MKFVHIADMHFDMPFTTLNAKENLGKIRRQQQREALKKIIQYIKQNKINYLFIAGDFYEHGFIRKSTIEYINNLFETIPETMVIITPGNHDPYIKNSMYQNFKWNKNVTIFTSKIEKIETPEADIYGIGFSNFHEPRLGIEKINIENKNKINILVTHGDLNGIETTTSYNPISKNELKKIGFDYVALGHIHKPDYQTEENQNIVYPGSTIAMGFDELGPHGFISGDIQKERINLQFIPVDEQEFKIIELDVTTINDEDELLENINTISLNENYFYEIVLIGKRKFEINVIQLYKWLIQPNLIKIKNETRPYYSLEEMSNNYTLKGIFVQEILEEMQKQNYSQEELDEILEIGLSLLENNKFN